MFKKVQDLRTHMLREEIYLFSVRRGQEGSSPGPCRGSRRRKEGGGHQETQHGPFRNPDRDQSHRDPRGNIFFLVDYISIFWF